MQQLNIISKDLDLLSKISGMPKNFKVIPTLPAIESLPVEIVGGTPIPVAKITAGTKTSPTSKPTPPPRQPITDGNPLNHIRKTLAIALEKEQLKSTVTPVPTTPPRPEPAQSTEIVAEIEIQPRLDPEAAEQKAPQKPTAQASTQKRRDRGGR